MSQTQQKRLQVLWWSCCHETFSFRVEDWVQANKSFHWRNLTSFHKNQVLLHWKYTATAGVPREWYRVNPISCYIKTARGPRTRMKARAEAATVCEFNSSCHLSCRTHLYSRAEDDLLQNLMDQGLSWDEVRKSFSQRFAGRELRSPQMHWSRSLKFTLLSLSTRWCSKRKRSCRSWLDNGAVAFFFFLCF